MFLTHTHTPKNEKRRATTDSFLPLVAQKKSPRLQNVIASWVTCLGKRKDENKENISLVWLDLGCNPFV